MFLALWPCVKGLAKVDNIQHLYVTKSLDMHNYLSGNRFVSLFSSLGGSASSGPFLLGYDTVDLKQHNTGSFADCSYSSMLKQNKIKINFV